MKRIQYSYVICYHITTDFAFCPKQISYNKNNFDKKLLLSTTILYGY